MSNQTKADLSKDPLMEFQLANLSVNEKSSKEFGLQVSKKIWGFVVSGLGGYYFNRNTRFRKNRNYANGRIDVQAMYQDRLEMNGKQNYIRLNWQTLQLVNRIISGLIGRWMQRSEKIEVKAIDDLSQNQKREEYDKLEFIIQYKQKLEELQEATGVQMIPDTDIPADKEELNLWQAQFQRIPEEILYELGINDVLAANGWYDVLKEKALHDSSEVGLVGTKTWMDEQGVVHVDWVKPENQIYSFTEYPDMRDTTWRGEVPSMKISELRRGYGKEFHPENPLALTEEEIYDIACTAKEFQYYSNLNWTTQWNFAYLRPYDEWNVRAMKFELKTVDSEPYTITTSKSTGTTYTQKGYPTTASGKKRDKPSDNQQVVEDSNWNIYEGVYLPDNDVLLKWGLKKNMIRPQDPREIGNAEFSYSYYMYQPYEMRNMAVPEKIEAAVDGMILSLLKMQQVVARMRPTGAAIDESALQNIDYGLGDAGNKDVDYKKLYDQTGDIYYRGLDAEGNRIPIPIVELKNSGFLDQMQGLIQMYQFWYQTLKDELGEDPNLISAALQPRVTGGNVQASQQMSEYATDYMYRAFAECMKMTARKVSCLLKDSVTYGSQAYRNIVKQEDIGLRRFSTNIKFLPTANDVLRFEAMMNETIAGNPDIVLFVNPFQLMQMAKEDVKLAWIMFNSGRKKMLVHRAAEAKANQDATFKAQIESAKAGEEGKQETERVKGDVDIASKKMEGDTAVKTSLSVMFTSLMKDGAQIPSTIQPIFNAWAENVMIPMVAQNEQQKAEMIEQYKQAQQEPIDDEIEEQAEQPIQPQQPEMAA